MFLAGEGISLPTAVTTGDMEKSFTEVKFFLCVVTAWDVMLAPPPNSKRQRQADLEAVQASVTGSCADLFPSSLMTLLEQWVDGKDIALALP